MKAWIVLVVLVALLFAGCGTSEDPEAKAVREFKESVENEYADMTVNELHAEAKRLKVRLTTIHERVVECSRNLERTTSTVKATVDSLISPPEDKEKPATTAVFDVASALVRKD